MSNSGRTVQAVDSLSERVSTQEYRWRLQATRPVKRRPDDLQNAIVGRNDCPETKKKAELIVRNCLILTSCIQQIADILLGYLFLGIKDQRTKN